MYDELVKNLRNCAKVNSLSLYKRGLMKQAADAIEEQQAAEKKYLANIGALETENQHLKREREWISVTERLPKEEETVLAWGKLGIITFDWRHDNKWCCFGDVTHWMPLPEPPKEG